MDAARRRPCRRGRARAARAARARPSGAKMIAASSGCGGGSSEAPGPARAELARERLRGVVAGAGEGEDARAPASAATWARMCAAAPKPYRPSALRLAAHAQRAVADQPGAQQRRELLVGVARRAAEAVARVGDGVLGHAAVDVAAGEAGPRAEVLAAAAAVLAVAVGPAEPRHADEPPVAATGPRPCPAARSPRRRSGGRGRAAARAIVDLAVEQVQVGAAHAARPHPQQQLARARARDRQLASRAAARRPPRRPSRASCRCGSRRCASEFACSEPRSLRQSKHDERPLLQPPRVPGARPARALARAPGHAGAADRARARRSPSATGSAGSARRAPAASEEQLELVHTPRTCARSASCAPRAAARSTRHVRRRGLLRGGAARGRRRRARWRGALLARRGAGGLLRRAARPATTPRPARAMGFCLFNNVAVAAAAAIAELGRRAACSCSTGTCTTATARPRSSAPRATCCSRASTSRRCTRARGPLQDCGLRRRARATRSTCRSRRARARPLWLALLDHVVLPAARGVRARAGPRLGGLRRARRGPARALPPETESFVRDGRARAGRWPRELGVPLGRRARGRLQPARAGGVRVRDAAGAGRRGRGAAEAEQPTARRRAARRAVARRALHWPL